MSWKASAWAKDQRLGSPAAKSILMCLGDYADPEGVIKGWASQSELAASAEVSERSAREWLQRLDEWGLIERRHQQKPNGARAADWIVLRLDRKVTDGCERLKAEKTGAGAESLPAESAGRTYRQPDADPTGNEAHPTGTQFRAHKEEPPLEPPLPSHQERADAREREGLEGQDRKKIETRGWKLLARWPGFAGMPKNRAIAAWMALGEDERDRAERRFDAWLALLKAQRKDHVPAPSTYFGERLFDEVADPDEAPPPPVEAKPFGRAGMALRLSRLVAGPTFTALRLTAIEERMVADGKADRAALLCAKQAAQGFPEVTRMDEQRSVTVAPEIAALGDGFVQARRGDARFADWERLHERRGWPWLPSWVDWVWLPDGEAASAIHEFEAAISASVGKVDRVSEAAE